MLGVRLISGFVLIFGLAAVVYWSPPWLFHSVVIAATFIALREVVRMPRERKRIDGAVGVLLGTGIVAVMAFHPHRAFEAAIVAFLAATVTVLLTRHPVATPAGRLGHLALALFYVPLLFGFACPLFELPGGRGWVFVACFVAFGGDTFAYFTGRAFGRHLLIPSVSPGKTIEGSLGGFLGSIAGAFLAKFLFLDDLGAIHCVVIGLLGGALGQIGDLVESMLKRSFEIKDSGTLIPGHGGLLDRIDALLFVIPFVYQYATKVVGPIA